MDNTENKKSKEFNIAFMVMFGLGWFFIACAVFFTSTYVYFVLNYEKTNGKITGFADVEAKTYQRPIIKYYPENSQKPEYVRRFINSQISSINFIPKLNDEISVYYNKKDPSKNSIVFTAGFAFDEAVNFLSGAGIILFALFVKRLWLKKMERNTENVLLKKAINK